MRTETRIFIIFVSTFIIMNMLYVAQHENVHKRISEDHGCVNGKINYGITSTWNCFIYEDRTEALKLQESLLHDQNEIVGYQIQMLMSVMIICFMFLAFSMVWLSKGE